MKINNIFVTEIIYPTEFSMTMEISDTFYKLCKKKESFYIISDAESKTGQRACNIYEELGTNNTYVEHDEFGYIRVGNAIPLSEYYYPIGLRKKNNHSNKKEIHELVKTAKKNKLI